MSNDSKPASLTDTEIKGITKLLDDILEPQISELIKVFNKKLEHKGVIVGATIEWYLGRSEKDADK